MNKIGSWDTFDTPIKKQEEALLYLQEEFGKIGGRVWEKENAHDFGEYTSFEVDMPDRILEAKEDRDFLERDAEREDTEAEIALANLDSWIQEANNIYEEYRRKFL